MTTSDYWTRVLRGRSSRRRAIAGVGSIGLGAAAIGLVGCGGGNGSGGGSSGSGDKSSQIVKPKDTTSSAKAGGTLRGVRLNDIPSMDPHVLGNASTIAHVSYVYPQLLRFVPAKYPDTGSPDNIAGELAESFELSNDHLQVTLKIRQGLKWDSRAPTSGRVIDAEDVVWSYNRYAKLSPLKGDLAYSSTNSESPIESVSQPDSKTVVFKLAKPNASILQLLAAYTIFYVLPREIDSGGFDPKGETRGYGPYTVQDYKASSSVTYVRNPDYHQKGLPYVQTVELPIVMEYAARLAQFRAGNIYSTVVTQDDVVPTKNDLPETDLRQADSYTAGGIGFVGFGYAGDSPFKDQRVRQAASMLMDREAFLDVFANRQKFKDAGLDLQYRWNTVLPAGWEGYWLDPSNDKEFGASAKYLRFDPAEAKKLLSAAGFPSGFKTSLYYASAASGYGAAYEKEVQAYAAMLKEGGIDPSLEVKDYAGDYFTNYYYGQAGGNQKSFNGMIYGREFGYPTAAVQIFSTLHSKGPRFHGGSPNGADAHLGDSTANAMIDKLRVEFDVKQQQAQAQDLQRYLAGQAYNFVSPPQNALAFSLYWPVLQNIGVYRPYTGYNQITAQQVYYWLDETKAPVKKA